MFIIVFLSILLVTYLIIKLDIYSTKLLLYKKIVKRRKYLCELKGVKYLPYPSFCSDDKIIYFRDRLQDIENDINHYKRTSKFYNRNKNIEKILND